MSSFRNHLLKSLSCNYIIVDIPHTIAGDVCFYDTVNNEFLFIRGWVNQIVFPKNNYEPIGIVVIPGSHSNEIYGENTCAIISLVDMSASNPTNGTTAAEGLCFAKSGDIGNLNNFNVVIVEDGNGGLKTNGFGYLSKNGEYASTTLRIPDPYLSDGSRNPDYYNTTISKYNCMSDFGGRKNSNAVLTTRGAKDYSTWKPGATTGSDYPAVSCCDMYFTEGTSQTDWYLPASGEWGYVMSKWDIIRKSISMLNANYGNIYKQLEDNASYWTTSEHNSNNVRYVHTDNGMGHMAKTSAAKVRAFTIIK